jgi:sugar lactone lactonase YvrE
MIKKYASKRKLNLKMSERCSCVVWGFSKIMVWLSAVALFSILTACGPAPAAPSITPAITQSPINTTATSVLATPTNTSRADSATSLNISPQIKPAAKPAGGAQTDPGLITVPKPSGISASQTVGLLYKDTNSFAGYTLFSPNRSTLTYLIDMEGKLVHTWKSSYTPGQSVYLVEDGTLVRSAHISNVQGPAGGGVQKIAWDGTLLWDLRYLSDTCIPHHDIRPLPNGNILLICWDIKTKEQAVAAGRNPALLNESSLWPEKIVEIKPDGTNGGTVVWEWRLWDHLIQDFDSSKANYGNVSEHPELMDLNFGGGGNSDWIHANSVDYNPKYDQILISAHNTGEIWIIDHSTTTTQAAGHTGGKCGKGGDLLYRWGNPRAYRAGAVKDQKLYAQHNANWIGSGLPGEGNILIFNNGDRRQGGNYSSVDEITPPVNSQGYYALSAGSAYGPSGLAWSYQATNTSDFFADKISGAQRLANGNTLICHGPLGTFFEVSKEGKIVWEYVNPIVGNSIIAQGAKVPSDPSGGTQNSTFRATRLVANDSALSGKDLTPQKTIEMSSPVNTPSPATLTATPDFSRMGQLNLISDKFKFTEGPAWDKNQNILLFSDIDADKIYKLSLPSTISVFRGPSNKSNGLTFDTEGRLLAAEHWSRSVTRTGLDGKIETLADSYQGKRLNSPNDLVVRRDGNIYFTDPAYGLGNRPAGVDFMGLYRISPAGELILEGKFDKSPNGVVISPDQNTLYLALTTGSQIMAFDLDQNGDIKNGRLFAVMPQPDGMTVDIAGNIYIAGPDGVYIFSQQGTQLGIIKTNRQPTNCEFGGPGGNTLFITAREDLYSAESSVPGFK